MGNDQAKILVEEYLEVEGYPKETRRKVFKHFRKDIEQKNADLETIIEQLRSGDHADLRRNEEYILRALPDKYEIKCYQFLYEAKVKNTRLYQDLIVQASHEDAEALAIQLCKVAYRVVCVPKLFILDIWKNPKALDKQWDPTSPILVFLREGSVEFVEDVDPIEGNRTMIDVKNAQRDYQTLNFPEHRVIGPGYTIETSPLIGDKLILQREFVLARALNPDSAARRTRVGVRAKDYVAYGVIRKRDFDAIVSKIPAIHRRYDELLADQVRREGDAARRIRMEAQRVAHTALINAVTCGNLADIQNAISAGADVNAASLHVDDIGHRSNNIFVAVPIHVAVQFAQVESLKLLLQQSSILIEQPRKSDGII